MPVRVLIVDDSLIFRTILKEILDKAPFEVVGEAKDGEEALALFRTLSPDLVLMDIVLPKKDGLTALSQIIDANPLAKVIVISALGQQAMVIDALYRGARDFIAKPFSGEKVLEIVCAVAGVDQEQVKRQKIDEKIVKVYRKPSIVD